MAVAEPAALIQFVLVGFAFACLMQAFIRSDFSLKLVTENSHSLKPMLYKIAGVWGNHEGSLLLWVLILTLFGAAAAAFGQDLPAPLRARVLAVQGAIGAAFLGFLIFTSNPFLRLAVPPLDGQDLNPLLQDPGLAFHPPFLYLGYVGLSMAYAFAVAALIEGRIDAAWGRWVRPWTLAAWCFLTIGIAMGSWWAYYELGWGGFWFWDPVENASFMPWLVATALLHSAIVVEKREALKAWTMLLAIIAFGFSLTGTFIVRSGVLTSVHAFANDPARGVFILAILARLHRRRAERCSRPAPGRCRARASSRWSAVKSALVVNNILLAVAALVVFVGTLWPLVAELILEPQAVGRPAVLRRRLHALHDGAGRGAAGRRALAVEACPARPRDGPDDRRLRAGGGARGAGLGVSDRANRAGADWRRAGVVADRRRAQRSLAAGGRPPGAALAAAAGRLGPGRRPCRVRGHDLRRRRADRLDDRGYPGREDRRNPTRSAATGSPWKGSIGSRDRTTAPTGRRCGSSETALWWRG